MSKAQLTLVASGPDGEKTNPPGGGNSGGGDMETRVAKIEQNIGDIKTDIAVIKTRLDHLERNTATKADMAGLKTALGTEFLHSQRVENVQ